MQVVEITEFGGPEVLKIGQRSFLKYGPDEILIRIHAAGINRPDCLQRLGHYPPPRGATDIPGLEVAGIVERVGKKVTKFAVGDAVCALLPGGGYAEYAKCHEDNVLPVPNGLSMVEAAALPETYFTVWHNVFQRGFLQEGETFLVHGGSSGIGTTAIQLAKAFGATVFTTVGSREKCKFVEDLGADFAIDYKRVDFVEYIKHKTEQAGVNLILDMIGGDYINRNYSVAAIEGRIVQIAFQRGRKAQVDFAQLMAKRLMHSGSTLRARPVSFKAHIASELIEQVWPLLATKKVKPIIDRTFLLSEASDAHAYMETSEHMGKIVLTLNTLGQTIAT